MNFNIEHHLDAVERSVVSSHRDGKAAKAVTVVRDIPATIDDLWNALTSTEHLSRWFSPISGNLELGGRYQLEGNAGGTIKRCEAPTYFSVTWEWQGDISWLEVRLDKKSEKLTTLTLTYTALVAEFWNEYGPGATGIGWELGLAGLEQYLIDPDTPKINEEELASSAEGKSFITQSSEGWGNASVADGTDAIQAREAAKRTTAFYTGEAADNS